MLVHEIFKSIQGEGPQMGYVATFIRLWGCNLQCEWCDTPQNDTDKHEMSCESVANTALSFGNNLFVVTGGEPMLQQSEVEKLFLTLTARLDGKLSRAIETSGSIWLSDALLHLTDVLVLSPKLGSSHADRMGVDPLEFYNIFYELFYANRSSGHMYMCYKFVVGDDSDLKAIHDFIKLVPPEAPIILQPEDGSCATAAESMVRQFAVMKALPKFRDILGRTHKDIRILPRLHRLIFDERAGV